MSFCILKRIISGSSKPRNFEKVLNTPLDLNKKASIFTE